MKQAGSKVLKGLRLTALVAVGATALAVMPAWADTVTSWDYTFSTHFDTSQTVFSDGCETSGGNINNQYQLAWGCPSDDNRSTLYFDPANGQGGGTAQTYEGPGIAPPVAPYVSDPGVNLIHSNYVINGSHLKVAVLDNTITITNPPGSTGTPTTLHSTIHFIETDNLDNGDNCTVPPTSGNIPCPDIFAVSRNTINQPFHAADGQEYFLSLFPTVGGELNVLSDDACEAAGADDGCYGFITQENQANEMSFGITISTNPILQTPEPGALGLMGLGLLGIVGLVILRRRRAAEDSLD